MLESLEFSKIVPCDSNYLYKWHNMPCALDRLIPYWEKVSLREHPDTLVNGGRVALDLHLGPISIPWNLELSDVVTGQQFKDTQITGPFSFWSHTHKMQAINDSNSMLVENIKFSLPLSEPFLIKPFAVNKIKRLFNYRMQVISNDVKRHYKYKDKNTMRILVSGASGLVGDALVKFLSSGGHQVLSLVRVESTAADKITWFPPKSSADEGYIDFNALEGLDAVVHLAGENIASGRWTESQKKKIYDSRVLGTNFLVDQLLKLKQPPKVLIAASAIGFYGHSDTATFNEESPVGSGFLSDTCIEWEKAARRAEEKGIRVVNARLGIVLDPKAGALAKMLQLFSLGGGGILGSGKQFMSWISLDDVIGAIHHCIMNESIHGPVNLVSPEVVTNAEFTKILAKVLNRPAIFPAPAFALRLVLGEMADALLLSSAKVEPKVLQSTDYDYSFSNLELALRHMLGK